MRLLDLTPLSKAEQLAVTLQESGVDGNVINTLTTIKRSRIEKLNAPTVAITRSLVTAMLLDAYNNADTANEVVNVAKELAKLHGLNEPEKVVTLNVASGDITKQLSSMSNDELFRLIGQAPETIIIEGECSE